MNKELIIVGGPTGTGKTQIALALARQLNGELINADSRQIYKYLDIGTNKGKIQEVESLKFKVASNSEFIIQDSGLEIPIHLVSFLEPDQRFNLFDYKKLAEEKILDILSRDKTPILIGGTGLYIDSILRGYKLVKNEKILNKQLGTRNEEQLTRLDLEKKSIVQLNEIIKKLEIPIILNESDSKNPRRLIRVIEKSQESEIPIATNNNTNNIRIDNQDLNVKFYYPNYNFDELKIKLEERVEQMFKDGLLEETQKVLGMGYKKDCPGLNVMGYRECIEYLDGKISLEECKESIKKAHIAYAKRQKTWFEGDGRNYNLIKINSV